LNVLIAAAPGFRLKKKKKGKKRRGHHNQLFGVHVVSRDPQLNKLKYLRSGNQRSLMDKEKKNVENHR
jgi:hypothetical protein